jgi:hypothetical protein
MSDLEIDPAEPLPPESIYARVAQEAELEVVVRMCAVDVAAELSGVTKENVVAVAKQIAEFMLHGAAKPEKRLSVVKNDAAE